MNIIFQVLFPETLIRIRMDRRKISYEQAEDELCVDSEKVGPQIIVRNSVCFAYKSSQLFFSIFKGKYN